MRWYGFAGPLGLVVVSWALALFGPAERREMFLGMVQGATAGLIVLLAKGLLAGRLYRGRTRP